MFGPSLLWHNINSTAINSIVAPDTGESIHLSMCVPLTLTYHQPYLILKSN